jgi:aerobic C4-dicarboxylate transport protein
LFQFKQQFLHFLPEPQGHGSLRLKKVGRGGLKTRVYFEVVSTVALAIGLLVGEIVQPGKGFNIDPATLDAAAVSRYVARAHEDSVVAHLLSIIPGSFFGVLAEGNLLQVLPISILSGLPSRTWAPAVSASAAS